MAVAHPSQTWRTLVSSPQQVHRSFHWWFFQLSGLPETAIAANDFAFIDYLWKYWSPGHEDAAHLAEVKRMLALPGALTAALAYYRAMFDTTKADPALDWIRDACNQPITVPTLALCGSNDLRGEMLEGQKEFFEGPYEWTLVEGCGHFLHRERPAEVTRLVIEWLHAN
jgi:pimeloyl-ACP methyl ester carboxylesterase